MRGVLGQPCFGPTSGDVDSWAQNSRRFGSPQVVRTLFFSAKTTTGCDKTPCVVLRMFLVLAQNLHSGRSLRRTSEGTTTTLVFPRRLRVDLLKGWTFTNDVVARLPTHLLTPHPTCTDHHATSLDHTPVRLQRRSFYTRVFRVLEARQREWQSGRCCRHATRVAVPAHRFVRVQIEWTSRSRHTAAVNGRHHTVKVAMNKESGSASRLKSRQYQPEYSEPAVASSMASRFRRPESARSNPCFSRLAPLANCQACRQG